MATAADIARLFAARSRVREERTAAHCQRMLASVPELVGLLVTRGASRVWVFGSLAWGTAHEGSDLDLAAEGLPAAELLGAQGALLMAAPGRVDLVRIEEAPAALAARIRAEGRLVHG